jgi:hypothetical protein
VDLLQFWGSSSIASGRLVKVNNLLNYYYILIYDVFGAIYSSIALILKRRSEEYSVYIRHPSDCSNASQFKGLTIPSTV